MRTLHEFAAPLGVQFVKGIPLQRILVLQVGAAASPPKRTGPCVALAWNCAPAASRPSTGRCSMTMSMESLRLPCGFSEMNIVARDVVVPRRQVSPGRAPTAGSWRTISSVLLSRAAMASEEMSLVARPGRPGRITAARWSPPLGKKSLRHGEYARIPVNAEHGKCHHRCDHRMPQDHGQRAFVKPVDKVESRFQTTIDRAGRGARGCGRASRIAHIIGVVVSETIIETADGDGERDGEKFTERSRPTCPPISSSSGIKTATAARC